MARRRVISSEMLVDPEYNSLSMEAQLLFVRMLVVSDDYGIVPLSEFRLTAMVNPPDQIRKNLIAIIYEILDASLGFKIIVDEKPFFCFKPKSFKYWQAQLLSRRIKSEYLRKSGEDVLKLFSEHLQVNLEDLCSHPKTSELGVESRKQREDGSEQKVCGCQAVDSKPSLFRKGGTLLDDIERQYEEERREAGSGTRRERAV